MGEAASVVDKAALREARRVRPVYSGERLTALRELAGMNQRELAEAIGITPASLSQGSNRKGRLSAPNIARAAAALDVTPEAFGARRKPEMQLMPQFRYVNRMSTLERRQALHFVQGVADLVAYLRGGVAFPASFAFSHPVDPTLPVGVAAEAVEAAALDTRAALGLEADEPFSCDSLLGQFLESNGVIFVRDPMRDQDDWAFSAIVNNLPIIVASGEDASTWEIDYQELAYCLGQIVMHQGLPDAAGSKSAIAQADRFGRAFLAPGSAIKPELPQRLDWRRYMELKHRWGMSIASLIERSHDLGITSAAARSRALSEAARMDWAILEPGAMRHPTQRPYLLPRAVRHSGLTVEHLAEWVGLPKFVARRIVPFGGVAALDELPESSCPMA